jgi:bacterioferritin
VIEIYPKLVNYFGNADSTSRRMFEDLIADEEDHANDLSDLIVAIDPRNKPI